MRTKDMLISIGTAFLIGAFLSPFASSLPDGLEWVSERLGFSAKATSIFNSAPMADYIFPGLGSGKIATAFAGFIGTLFVFVLAWFIFRLLMVCRKTEEKGQER